MSVSPAFGIARWRVMGNKGGETFWAGHKEREDVVREKGVELNSDQRVRLRREDCVSCREGMRRVRPQLANTSGFVLGFADSVRPPRTIFTQGPS